RNFQGNVAGAGAQTPVTGGLALNVNITAASLGAQPAFDAVELDVARTGFCFHAATRTLLYFNIAAAGAGDDIASHILRADVAAAGITIQNTFDGVDFQIARAGADARIARNVLHGDVAGAGLGRDRKLQAADREVAGATVRVQARLRGHGNVIVDGDVAGEIAVINLADDDGVAVL